VAQQKGHEAEGRERSKMATWRSLIKNGDGKSEVNQQASILGEEPVYGRLWKKIIEILRGKWYWRRGESGRSNIAIKGVPNNHYSS